MGEKCLQINCLENIVSQFEKVVKFKGGLRKFPHIALLPGKQLFFSLAPIRSDGVGEFSANSHFSHLWVEVYWHRTVKQSITPFNARGHHCFSSILISLQKEYFLHIYKIRRFLLEYGKVSFWIGHHTALEISEMRML